MVKPIRETETTRDYLLRTEEINGVRYYHVRTYTLTDRWRRTKDRWYKVEEEPEMKKWVINFDIRKDYPK